MRSFRFYPSDFLGSTADLSLEAAGAAAKVMCKMYQHGTAFLPYASEKDKQAMAHLFNVSRQRCTKLVRELTQAGGNFRFQGGGIFSPRIERDLGNTGKPRENFGKTSPVFGRR